MLNYTTNRLESQGKSGQPSTSTRKEGQGTPLYLNTVNNLTSEIRACSFPSHFCSEGLAKEKGS